MAFCKVPPVTSRNGEIKLEDLYAVPHLEKYIWAPGGLSCLWSKRYVNSIMPKIDTGRRKNGKSVAIAAVTWLDAHRAVKQITWAPGEPEIIENRLIFAGGWKAHAGVHVLNVFQPPPPITGDPTKAGPWIDHVRLIYPNEADEIMDWFAHRIQHIGIKINFALVLGGPMGIGKDWLIEVLRIALGADNYQLAKPAELTKDNNSFIKTLVLHVDETHNLGETGKITRFSLYETIKALAAAPPVTLPCADKWIKRHYIPNALDLVITTNHSIDGIFLDPDDRRHFVCWSEVTKEQFADGFWSKMYNWMRKEDGAHHAAAFLMQRDLSKFDAGAPPRQTAAFFEIVQASVSPEDAALADALDELAGYDKDGEPKRNADGEVARPDIVTIDMIRATTRGAGMAWLDSPKSGAAFSHRMKRENFVLVRYPNGNKGQWFFNKQRQTLYGKTKMSEVQRQQAAWAFMSEMKKARQST